MDRGPPPKRARLCFLVGAGASPGLPKSRDIIIPLLRRILDREPTDEEANIRFERFMQIIKEYLDPRLSFLSEIYAKRPRAGNVHPYSRLFAALAASKFCDVFTTNFDLNIENGQRPFLGFSSDRIQPIVTPSDYRLQQERPRQRRVFKLHGSADAPDSLAATYDTTSRAQGGDDPRFAAFSAALSNADLCVLGYSGQDDMDVVPTLVNTRAEAGRLFWFHHVPAAAPGMTPCDRLLSDPDSVDPRIRRDHLPVLRVFEALKLSGARDPSTLFVCHGPSAICLSRLSPSLRLSRRARRLIGQLAASDGREIAAAPAPQAELIIDGWFRHLPQTRKALLPCVAADAVHIQSEDSSANEALIQRLRDALARASRSRDANGWVTQIFLMNALAQLLYWEAETHETYRDELGELADETIGLADRLLDGRGWPVSVDVAPGQVASAVSQTLVWHAESMRIAEEFDESAKILASEYAAAPAELARALSNHASFRQAALKRAALGETALIVAKANWLTTQGDLNLSTQAVPAGLVQLNEATREWRRVGNSYWANNSSISRAGGLYMLGRFQEASDACREVLIANTISGGTRWMDFYPMLYLADIERVRASSDVALQAAAENLGPVMTQTEDVLVAEEARLIDWALRGAARDSHARAAALKREFSSLVSASVLSEQELIGVELCYAEFLIHVGHDEEAAELVEDLVDRARDLDAPISRLRALVLAQLLKLRAGQRPSWQVLYRSCQRRSFDIGCAWCLCLAVAGGSAVEQATLSEWRRWAIDNGMERIADILVQGGAAIDPRRLRMAFPMGWS